MERRTSTDRRRGLRAHDTPTPFAVGQLVELRARFAGPGPVICPACGSRVTFGPARRTESQATRLVVCIGCRRGAVLPDPGTARVLVVGANEALRDILWAPLAHAGHDVTEAPDAGVGLAAHEANPADVILLDVRAAGRMGAPEFLRRLRATSPGARVVALVYRTSKGEADEGGSAPDLDGVPTIQLPISREDLLRAIDEARAAD